MQLFPRKSHQVRNRVWMCTSFAAFERRLIVCVAECAGRAAHKHFEQLQLKCSSQEEHFGFRVLQGGWLQKALARCSLARLHLWRQQPLQLPTPDGWRTVSSASSVCWLWIDLPTSSLTRQALLKAFQLNRNMWSSVDLSSCLLIY